MRSVVYRGYLWLALVRWPWGTDYIGKTRQPLLRSGADCLLNKKLLLPLVPLLLLGIFLGIPSVVPPAHAAGTVCFNDPASFSTSAPCAPAGTALNGPAPSAALTNAIPAGSVMGTNQIRVGVYLSGPDLINGFDITVLADRTVLRPAAVDFSNTILASPTSIVVECLDGALVTGPTCLSSDVPGTIHLSLSGAAGVLSTASTGLVFTAIYNITAKSAATIPIAFQTGCGSVGSPTSDPPLCVTITNGGSGPVSESVGTIGFNNSVDPNWVAISTPSPTSYSFNVGAASPVASISATAENGYPGLVGTDSVSFTSIQSAGLTISFTGAVTSCATGGLTCSVSASFGGAAGTYFVTFFGNYVYSNDTILGPDGTLDGTVSLVVNIQDVQWSINGANEYPLPTTAQTLYMGTGPTHPMPLFFTVTSVGGYTGTITYSTAALTGTPGLVFTYPVAFTLGAGLSVTKIINGTATTTGSANYVARIVVGGFAGTTGTHSSGLQTVKMSGFTLTSNSTGVTFAPGGSKNVQLTSTSLGNPPGTNGFAGSVALTAPYTGPAGGVLTFTFTPAASITLTAGGTGSVNVAISGTVAGSYTVTFTGTGGTNNDMTNSTAAISVTVTAPVSPGINLDASPTSVTANVGSPGGTSTISVATRGTFTGNVDLTVSTTGSATCSVNPASIALAAFDTSTLSCSSPTAETDTATVTATSGTTTNSTLVTFIFQDFQITASSPAAVNAGQSAISTITATAVNGFAGVVTLTDTLPAGLTCGTITPGTLTGSGTATVSCSATVAGTYVLTITGTSGSLVHTATATFTFTVAQDFTITATSPASANVGQTTTSTITITAVGGFSGAVSLTDTVPAGLTCGVITPSSVTGSGTASVSCSATVAGSYVLVITGTSTSPAITHSTTATFNFVDFTLAASPTTVSVAVNSAGTSTITISPVNGFTSNVALASDNAACTLTPTTVTGGSGTSTLSCTFAV